MQISSNTTGHYSPRDIVNAPALKQRILQRSTERADPDVIRAWLGNHFQRGLISTFDNVLLLTTDTHWHTCMPGQPVPAWFQQRCGHCYFIDPEHPRLLALERKLLEFLYVAHASPLASKLHKINYFQALQRWQAAHERMRQRRLRGWFPSSPQALRTVLDTPLGRVVEITGDGASIRAEMAYESFHMQHCLGDFADRQNLRGGYGEQYALSVLNRERRVLSLRDASNRPHVTVSLVRGKGRWVIEQVKGKQNRAPVERYWDTLITLFTQMQLSVAGVWDCAISGIIELPGGGETAAPQITRFQQAGDTPQAQALLVQCPWLLMQHPRPNLINHWLALAGDERGILQFSDPPLPHLAAALLPAGQWQREDPERWPAYVPDWLAELERQAAATGAQALDWRYRPCNNALTRWFELGTAFDHSARLRAAMRWALATADLLYPQIGALRYLNSVPEANLSPARARKLLQQSEQEHGLLLAERLRAMFSEPRLRDPAFVAHCQQLETGPLDVIAFSAVHMTLLLRLALAGKVVQRSLGIPLLLLNAQRLQDCFNGWQPMARAYSRGRHAVMRWQSHRNDIDYRVDQQIDHYLGQSRCNWNQLSWPLQPLMPQELIPAVLMQHCVPPSFPPGAPHAHRPH